MKSAKFASYTGSAPHPGRRSNRSPYFCKPAGYPQLPRTQFRLASNLSPRSLRKSGVLFFCGIHFTLTNCSHHNQEPEPDLWGAAWFGLWYDPGHLVPGLMPPGSSKERCIDRAVPGKGGFSFGYSTLPGNDFESTVVRWHHPSRGWTMRVSNLQERNALSEWTITADDAERRIARAIRTRVGNHLQEMYRHLLSEPLPPKIADLLRRLDR